MITVSMVTNYGDEPVTFQCNGINAVELPNKEHQATYIHICVCTYLPLKEDKLFSMGVYGGPMCPLFRGSN